MEKQLNEQLLTPKREASGVLLGQVGRGDAERKSRRAAKANRIYRNRKLALGAIVLAGVAAGAAGGGRLLVHDIEQGGHDAASNRVEAVHGAFSDSNPEVVTGEPSNDQAARQAQLNEAHNAVVAAAKAAQADAQPQ